jgi:hypothetical protein
MKIPFPAKMTQKSRKKIKLLTRGLFSSGFSMRTGPLISARIVFGLALLSSGVGTASEVPFGSGTGALDPRGGNVSSYTLQNSIVCPVITFGAGTFAGNGNQWGNNNFPPFYSANGGGTNFGGIAGVQIPLGGSLSEYCRKQALIQMNRSKLEFLISERNAAITYLDQCHWVQTYFPRYREYSDKFKPFLGCPDANATMTREIPIQEGQKAHGARPPNLLPQSAERQMTRPPTFQLEPSSRSTPVQIIQ